MRTAALLLLAAMCLSSADAQNRTQLQVVGKLLKSALMCMKAKDMVIGGTKRLKEGGIGKFLADPGQEIKCFMQCILHDSDLLNEEGKCNAADAMPTVRSIAKAGSFLLGRNNCAGWEAGIGQCLNQTYGAFEEQCNSAWNVTTCCAKTTLHSFEKFIKAMGGDNYIVNMIIGFVKTNLLGMRK